MQVSENVQVKSRLQTQGHSQLWGNIPSSRLLGRLGRTWLPGYHAGTPGALCGDGADGRSGNTEEKEQNYSFMPGKQWFWHWKQKCRLILYDLDLNCSLPLQMNKKHKNKTMFGSDQRQTIKFLNLLMSKTGEIYNFYLKQRIRQMLNTLLWNLKLN